MFNYLSYFGTPRSVIEGSIGEHLTIAPVLLFSFYMFQHLISTFNLVLRLSELAANCQSSKARGDWMLKWLCWLPLLSLFSARWVVVEREEEGFLCVDPFLFFLVVLLVVMLCRWTGPTLRSLRLRWLHRGRSADSWCVFEMDVGGFSLGSETSSAHLFVFDTRIGESFKFG